MTQMPSVGIERSLPSVGEALALLAAVITLTLVVSPLANEIESRTTWVAIYQIVCVALPVAIFLAIRRGVLASLLEASKPHLGTLALSAIAGGALALVNVALVIELLGLTTTSSAVATPEPAPLALALFVFALVPAVTEEILFRGLVLRALATRHRLAALIVSSALFAGFHFSLPQLAPLFVVGLGAGAVLLASGRVSNSIAFHLGNNGLLIAGVWWRPSWNLAVPQGLLALAVLAASLAILWTWRRSLR